ncbi:DNA-binding transcriptional MerR regulator [Amycolatopsis lexingtonensis]|uniref:DNA-binding transcriptional MerR regulator n=1 Tax=Amycolatopsis lexingtonensis TaxID=218822 RepID=A0ABR9HTJ1_9PSEU|nr:MerR family transcriptional regulator [Amycolatopsis lexingtonensis]MBE1494248.1 DNA-binding transcriptional MerR regulator [Amycolatopsis lexingtonensis]
MITIGRLAAYAGVSIKTVRVYHAKGLLPEPDRDASGYRRYTAAHAIDLLKIRTLAEAGVPLARIKELGDATPDEVREALHDVDRELTARIKDLRETQRRLRRLGSGLVHGLPPEVARHLEHLPGLGFSARWVAMETDLWILVYATHPELAAESFRDQAEALTDPGLRQLYLDYDRAHDLDPADPALTVLAGRIVAATRRRYGSGPLPGLDAPSAVPALIQNAVNAESPAWRRLDELLRAQLIPGR